MRAAPPVQSSSREKSGVAAKAGQQKRAHVSKVAAQPPAPVHPLLQLQRTIGNQAILRLLRSGRLQAKLTIGQPGDVYEQEADRVAEQVMRMPEPQDRATVSRQAQGIRIQRMCAECEEEEKALHAKNIPGGTPEVTLDLEGHINASRGGGHPLPESVRAFFEPCFGHHFSGIRVHTNGDADKLNRALSARAFTTGQAIYFRDGEYNTSSSSGRELLAHELTHVVQQMSGGLRHKLTVGQPGDKYEQEADDVARAVMQRQRQTALVKTNRDLLRRQPDDLSGQGGPANAGQLEQDMRDVLNDWTEASRGGVDQFIHNVLDQRIENIESGSWTNFILLLLGSTIWAASVFAIAAPPVFAISMVGVAIAAVPSVPRAHRSSLVTVEGMMRDYIDSVYQQLNAQLPGKSSLVLAAHPGASRYQAVARFIEASFKPEVRNDYTGYTELPQINIRAVRHDMFRKANYEFEAAERVGAAISSATGEYRRLGRPLPGVVDPRRRVFGGYVILEDRIEVVTNLYGHRANVDLAAPQSGLFNSSIPSFERGSIPPTGYFYHWLSRFAIGATTTEQSKILSDISRIRTSLTNTKQEQVSRRAALLAEVRGRMGGRDPSDNMLSFYRTNSPRYSDLRDPLHVEDYERAAVPIFTQIWTQLYDIQRQIGSTEPQRYVRELVTI